MPLSDLLTAEFDGEIALTRKMLCRIPDDKSEFKPHDKSMSMLKLANHTAQMPGFLSLVLTVPVFDLAQPDPNPAAPAADCAQRLAAFDAAAAIARAQLAEVTDRSLHENFALKAGDATLFAGSRYHAARNLFFNHMVHHRAQLGVYLRLNDCPVPSIYGPSADEGPAA